MREAEKEEKLVLLQNLDPTYTSEEVQVLAILLKNLFKSIFHVFCI